jgi:hypothetical protein
MYRNTSDGKNDEEESECCDSLAKGAPQNVLSDSATTPTYRAVRHVHAEAVGDSRAVAAAICNCAQRTPDAGPAKEQIKWCAKQQLV